MTRGELSKFTGFELASTLVSGAVCLGAGIVSQHDNTAAVVGLAVVASLWPLAVVAPARWQSRIDERHYMRAAGRLIAGPPLLAIAAAFATSQSDDYPFTAFVLGVGGLLFLVTGLSRDRKLFSRRGLYQVVAAGLGAVVGLLVDQGAGWHFLAYSLYGIASTTTTVDLLSGQVESGAIPRSRRSSDGRSRHPHRRDNCG
ncbi:MAG TPA: hypothetical protein VFB78_01620 [Acidimicrobiales bacterium]|nr:hypothetical protein [Acidimicrobiales bacterium]